MNPTGTITTDERSAIERLWAVAIAEDGLEHDVTSRLAIASDGVMHAALRARGPGVFAGALVLDHLTVLYGAQLAVKTQAVDGQRFESGHSLAELEGPGRLMLGIERSLLNFLQRLCGVATLTRRFVDAVAGTGAAIYDTRKTIPAWRVLDKYAVRCGGGCNHRMGLHDAVLVKDNHMAAFPLACWADEAARIVRDAAALSPRPVFIEFEVDALEQLDALLPVAGLDVILLDNFTPAQMREAVRRRDAAGLKGRLSLEASGGVNLERVREIAQTGVERIAVGAITHSATALDIGLDARTA